MRTTAEFKQQVQNAYPGFFYERDLDRFATHIGTKMAKRYGTLNGDQAEILFDWIILFLSKNPILQDSQPETWKGREALKSIPGQIFENDDLHFALKAKRAISAEAIYSGLIASMD